MSGPGPLPEWLAPLLDAIDGITADRLSRFVPPPGFTGRRSAVLVLFGIGADGPDVLLLERAAAMRSHAGQPAFPGGAIDPGDAGPVAAALREAREETGLDPAGVDVFATLPELLIPPTGFGVTPVLGWWRDPSPVYPAAPAEVAQVVRVPLAELADPANRVAVRLTSGMAGPAFRVRGLLVWGFTGGLLDRLLTLGGWERPWTAADVLERPVPPIAGAS